MIESKIKLTFDEAIELLQKTVKFSDVDKQKHIDLTLISAEKRGLYQQALMLTRAHVAQGLVTEDELKLRLGLS